MAGIFDKTCPSCGERHEFIWLDGDVLDGGSMSQPALYDYVCPKTNKAATVPAPEMFAEVVQIKPKDAVVVKRRQR